VPTKPARCLIQLRPDGAGEHLGSRSFPRRSSIIGIRLPPPTRPSARARTPSRLFTGVPRASVTRRSAGADLMRHLETYAGLMIMKG